MTIALYLFMLFAHIIDDYVLQGWLAQAKQKAYRQKNYPSPLYKYDYLCALFVHCLSWSISIMLPIIIYSLCSGIDLGWFYVAIPINLVIHFIVDDLKANKLWINLMIDQSIHFLQITLTWVWFILIF